jgi:hypothetical protein
MGRHPTSSGQASKVATLPSGMLSAILGIRKGNGNRCRRVWEELIKRDYIHVVASLATLNWGEPPDSTQKPASETIIR